MADLEKLLSEATPGPWTYSFESVDPEWSIVTTSGGRVIANVNADHRREANARLIALAPDLAAALIEAEKALAKIASCTSHHPDDVVGVARAALGRIRKITGGE